jgi:peptide-methionine (R)-S-oxide reductase
MSDDNQEEKFKKKLTPEQYRILRQKGTEAPFTGDLLHNKDDGMYKCAACGVNLFSSQHKFDSGTGWPSFYDVAQSGVVKLEEDSSLGMNRLEAVCANCGSHLGHVFEDGPSNKTGKQYCINSICLAFEPKDRQ